MHVPLVRLERICCCRHLGVAEVTDWDRIFPNEDISNVCAYIIYTYIQLQKTVYTCIHIWVGVYLALSSHMYVLYTVARTRVRTYQMSLYAYVCVLKCGTGASFNTKANVAENAQTHQRRCTQLWHPFYCAIFWFTTRKHLPEIYATHKPIPGGDN